MRKKMEEIKMAKNNVDTVIQIATNEVGYLEKRAIRSSTAKREMKAAKTTRNTTAITTHGAVVVLNRWNGVHRLPAGAL